MSFKKDFEYWEQSEIEIKARLEQLGYSVYATESLDILDFHITDKAGNKVWLELKSRRCLSTTYPDSMIWINKLIDAYKRYNESWTTTLFLFRFEDWFFYINPFLSLPRFEYRKGRWDRGDFDKPKAWCFFKTEDLILLAKYKY